MRHLNKMIMRPSARKGVPFLQLDLLNQNRHFCLKRNRIWAELALVLLYLKNDKLTAESSICKRNFSTRSSSDSQTTMSCNPSKNWRNWQKSEYKTEVKIGSNWKACILIGLLISSRRLPSGKKRFIFKSCREKSKNNRTCKTRFFPRSKK